MFKQTLYEKFTETSDPVKDMSIGMYEVWKKWYDEMGQRKENDVYNEYYSHLPERLPYHSIYILHNMLGAASKGEDHQKTFVKQCRSFSIGYESDFDERKEIAQVLDHEFGIKVDPRFNEVSLSLPLEEKFSEDNTDPVHDMGIGWPEFLKYLDKKTDDIIKIDITKEFGEEIINQVSTEKGNLYVALGDGKKCSEKESKQYKDQLQNIFKASEVDKYLIFPGTKTTWNNYPVCFKWKIQPEYVKAFEILWMRPRPTFLDENVNEKFSEDSDPIHDLGIGLYAKRNFDTHKDMYIWVDSVLPEILKTKGIPKDFLDDQSDKGAPINLKYVSKLMKFFDKYLSVNDRENAFYPGWFAAYMRNKYPRLKTWMKGYDNDYPGSDVNEKFTDESDPIKDMGIGIVKFWIKMREKIGNTYPEDTYDKYFAPDLDLKHVNTIKAFYANALYRILRDITVNTRAEKIDLQKVFDKNTADIQMNSEQSHNAKAIRKKLADVLKKDFHITVSTKTLNEKFSEETDPIADMRIGLTKVLQSAAKYIFDEDLKREVIFLPIDNTPDCKGTINYIEILNDKFMIKYYINKFFDADGNKFDNNIGKEEYFIDLLKKVGVYDALETSTDIKRGKNSITWKIKDKYVIYFKDGHYDEMEYEDGNPRWYRDDIYHLNEKFSEISDPVKDMGIGSPTFFRFEYDRLNNIPYEELRGVFDISNYNINTLNMDDKDAEMAICLIALYTIKGLGDKETVPNAFHDSYKHWVNAMGRRHLPSPQYSKDITQQILNTKYGIDWESTNRVDEKFSEENTDVVRDMGIGGFSFRQEFSKLIEKFKDPDYHYRLIKDILTDEGVKEYWVGLLTDWFVGKKVSGIFSQGNADSWGGPHQLTSVSKIVRVESFYDNPMRNDYMAMLDFALVSIEPGYWRSAPDAEDADGDGYLKNPDEMWYYYSPDDNKRTGLSTKDKIFTHEPTNEAFSEESDPIIDMGIGAMHKIWSKMADEVGHLNKVQFNHKYNLETEIDDAYIIYKILDKAGFRVPAQKAFDTVMAHWNTDEERIFIADVLSKHFQMDVDPKRYTNESFTNESDPIKDMGIGLNYKTLTKGAIIKVNKSVFLSRKYGIIVGRGKGYSLKPGMYLLVIDVYKLPQCKKHIDLLTYSDLNWAEINRKDFDKLTQGMIHNLANTCKINIREDQFNDKFEIIERGF